MSTRSLARGRRLDGIGMHVGATLLIAVAFSSCASPPLVVVDPEMVETLNDAEWTIIHEPRSNPNGSSR